MRDDGGPAFPIHPTATFVFGRDDGMTLRDYFAGQAVTFFPSTQENLHDLAARGFGFPDHYAVAAFCYDLADAMLAEREK